MSHTATLIENISDLVTKVEDRLMKRAMTDRSRSIDIRHVMECLLEAACQYTQSIEIEDCIQKCVTFLKEHDWSSDVAEEEVRYLLPFVQYRLNEAVVRYRPSPRWRWKVSYGEYLDKNILVLEFY